MIYTTATAIADGAGWDHMGSWGWGGMMIGWVLMAVLVAVVAWGLLGNIRQHPVNRALELLNERYARGEIDSDEYNERKGELSR